MPHTFSVVFAGTPAFAVPSLSALAADPAFSVSLVITQPDKPAGRRQELAAPPVKTRAIELGIPVIQPEDINTALPAMHSACDFLVVVAYGQILSGKVLAIPSCAPVNVHASLLPRWRGASPLQHALLAGDSETGVTVQQMVRALDAGDILAQRKTPIGPRETVGTLGERLAAMGAELLRETLKKPLHPVPQDPQNVSRCTKLARADGAADPGTMTAEEIDRRVRALVPWPGVTCHLHGKTVKLLSTALEAGKGSLPMPCAESTTLHVLTLQQPGGTPISGAEYLRGRRG